MKAVANGGIAEEYLAKHKYADGYQRADPLRHVLRRLLCRDIEESVPCAPCYEAPVGAVPQAAQHIEYKDVEVMPHGAAPAAAQREVDIVTQPAHQGHVPAAPKLAYGGSEEGVVEVGG